MKNNKRTKTLIDAQKRYEKKIVRKTIKFNTDNQEDVKLLNHINSISNYSNYLKELIKKSMDENQKEM